jgi:transposase InsO family protein
VKVHPFIEAEKAAGHGVARACRLLEVSRAAYYQRRHGVPSPRAAADAAITAKITVIHAVSGGTYGSPRIHQALRKDDGVACGKRRVARLMRTAGLEGRRKKRWRITTIADPAAEPARDLIRRDFAPCPGTDRRYAGDVTYIATWEGWAYLATVIDLASRKVVGWALADHMRTELVADALSMAFTIRRPPVGVIFHSDRGCQGRFNWSSQHLDHGGVRSGRAGSRCRRRPRVLGGSGRRIGRCGRRCGHRVGLSRLVRCSGSSGG